MRAAVVVFGVLAVGATTACTFDRAGIAVVDPLPLDAAAERTVHTDGPKDPDRGPRDGLGEAWLPPDGPGSDGFKPDAPLAPDVQITPDLPLKPDASGCPTSYTQSATGCHRIVTKATNWLAAEQDCEKDGPGAHLVVVDSTAENNALPDYAWIGLSERVKAGNYLLVTGKATTFKAYAPGEPVSGGAACIVTRPDGWHDDNCYELKSYICEHDGVPADPSAY